MYKVFAFYTRFFGGTDRNRAVSTIDKSAGMWYNEYRSNQKTVPEGTETRDGYVISNPEGEQSDAIYL